MVNPAEEIKDRDVLTDKEVDKMLTKADENPIIYYALRNKAIVCTLRLTGKRRIEVATLQLSNVKVKGKMLYLTFVVVKKRKKGLKERRRTKSIPLTDPLTQPILDYLDWMKTNVPESKYLFPRIHYNPIKDVMKFDPDNHLSGRQVLRIIKKLDPEAWVHLFRETKGAEIVRADPSVISVFKVKRTLDLVKEETAYRYMERYAAQVIDREEQK